MLHDGQVVTGSTRRVNSTNSRNHEARGPPRGCVREVFENEPTAKLDSVVYKLDVILTNAYTPIEW